jgi:hypothetical protein
MQPEAAPDGRSGVLGLLRAVRWEDAARGAKGERRPKVGGSVRLERGPASGEHSSVGCPLPICCRVLRAAAGATHLIINRPQSS